jgi:hypothetical protein
MILAHHPAGAFPAPRPSAARRGDAILEALVATLLLSVGVLALVALSVMLARDERRLASRRRAAVMMAEREAAWASSPCADATGGRLADGLRERWRVGRSADSLEVLVDSVAMPAGAAASEEAGLAAVRGCAP